jgi:hypothetical protein
MTHAQLISRWQRCEKLAGMLGMSLTTNSSNTLSVQGTPEGFKSFYSCDSVDELLGYLEGVSDAKSKLTNKS